MGPFQALIILILVIIIVWWALRRSAKESVKQAPTSHAHEAHAGHEAEAEAVHFEAVEPEPLPAVEAVFEPAAEPARSAELPVEVAEPAIEPELVVTAAAVEPEPVLEVTPDDLIIIEGIGPRISGVLKSHGVKTFAQLAAMQPEEIKAILTGVDVRLGRIADPTTWPQQAALAAKGDLEGLQKLQDSLKGGRL